LQVKKVGIISQARMTSTRLPGKVLLKIKNKTVIDYHLERLQQSGLQVYIATTMNSTDDIICSWAEQKKVYFYRGDEQNVLSRYYNCAEKNNLDIIVRVTSDCPLIDGEIIGRAVEEYISFNNNQIYYSNCLLRTFPRGFDFEIFSFALLEEAYQKATTEPQKEHVTPYIHQNVSGKVYLKHYTQQEDDHDYRITLDTPEDFTLIRKLIEDYDCDQKSAEEIIAVLKANSALKEINAHIEQKKF
jgi:spore coat polysaccharide biosynthesis protein SpsF